MVDVAELVKDRSILVALITGFAHIAVHLGSGASFSTLYSAGVIWASIVVFGVTYGAHRLLFNSEILDDTANVDSELAEDVILAFTVAFVVVTAHYTTHILTGDEALFFITNTQLAGFVTVATAFVSSIGVEMIEK